MNRMIALWAHPRSRSTVLERVFIERGDFLVFHELFAHMAFDQHSAIPSDNLDCGLPTTYETIKTKLRLARQDGHVFHKDMAYHCLDDLKADPDFLLEQQHVFIIREPGRSILSHFAIFPQMPLAAIGHQALHELFCQLSHLTGKIPWVINADDLARHPVETVHRLCDYLELEFLPHAMSWDKACPPQWLPWRSWHKDAEDSTRISAPSDEAFDPQLLAQYPQMKAYYDYHRPFYERMNQFAHGGETHE
ncbi:sulfotransferase family protein [Pseudomonas sp. NA-150]|uniref:sulfotransferase-like domain-containing protein n=1 Tax=Pseudomonas sp. NA-150 TaxID=3367525 RepID=UPI0037CC2ED3